MGDMMRGAPPTRPGQAPGMGGPPKSVMNPTDVGGMIGDGSINKGLTVGKWFQMMGISMDDPVGVALQKMQSQAKNQTALGKADTVGAARGGAPPAGRPPMGGQPPMGGAPSEPQGLAGLM